jgi:hypothetical protein
MKNGMLFGRNERPFGLKWEEWAALWCSWMLSIPKKNNPSLDNTGMYCSVNQRNANVWFLTGTFGNIIPVTRKCAIPAGRAIFFPILEKEDSFAEDSDLTTELELANRSKSATDELVDMEVIIDGIIFLTSNSQKTMFMM